MDNLNISTQFQDAHLADSTPRNNKPQRPDCADSAEILSRAKPFLDYLLLINGGNLRSEYRFRCLKAGAPTHELLLPVGPRDQVVQAFNTLDALNQDAYNVFVIVNDGVGTKTADIRACHCVYADWDGGDPAATEAKLAQVKALNPAAIVHTSRGKFHAYWQVSDIAIGQFSDVQKAVIRTLGTDKNIHDVTRIMRVPGFAHVKDPIDPQSVTLEQFQDAPVLSLADIVAKFGPITQENTAAPVTGSVRQAGVIDPTLLASLKSALAFIPNSEYDIWLQVGMALEFEGAPIETWKEWSSSDSSYDEAVCDSKWESFQRREGKVYRRNTIFHLAQENGWANDEHWLQPELDQAQDKLKAAIASIDTCLAQCEVTENHAIARIDADYYEGVGVLDDQRLRRQVTKNEHAMGVNGLKATRDAAKRQAAKDREAAVRAVHEAGLKLLDDHAAALTALKRQNSTTFVGILARLMVVTGLGKRPLDKAIHAAEVKARLEGNVADEKVKFLRGYALMTNENMVADIATGATYSQPVFAQLAEKAFPNQWDEPLHMALARSGGFQLAQEVYLPGRERIVTAENSLGIERQMLNIYNKPVLPPAVYSATKEKLFLEHISYMTGRDPVFVEYLLNWMASLVQRPEVKINSVPVIIGSKGTGKSFLGGVMMDLLGAGNCSMVTMKELAGQFHDGFAMSLLNIVPETRVHEKQAATMEDMKPLITDDYIACNRKGRAKITIPNVTNWLFLSNHEDALRIDAEERRYAIAISREARKPDDYYQELFGAFSPASGGSIESILHLLLNRDLSGFNPKAPAPWTAARDEMLDNLLSADGRVMRHWVMMQPKNMEGIELITFMQWQMKVEELCDPEMGGVGPTRYNAKSRSTNSLNKLAQDAGLVKLGQKRITAGARMQTLVYALRNTAQWRMASNEAIAEQFAKQQAMPRDAGGVWACQP